MSELPPRVLSGVQPSGTLHLGNYFGAIKQHLALQNEYPGECFFFIADYHALTTVQDAESLRALVLDVATTYLALGLDPDKATLWRQSDVPEVTELTWLLATVTGTGLLERGTSYKDKKAKGIGASAGLFMYPVLMAADILMFKSSMVPVGKDQIQHVEFTQDMATYFNEVYGRGNTILQRPEWRMSKAPYVPGLDGAKMSKSYGNTLPLFESGKALQKLCKKILTDSTPLGEALTWEGNNVVALLQLFHDEAELTEIKTWFDTAERAGAPFGYGHAKLLLADKIEAYFAEARLRREHLLAHPEEVEGVLQRGAERARSVAQQTMEECRLACGLR